MSLSAEALAQFEELDFREVKAGLDFGPIVESGRPTVADLTADEMNGFRAWDLSGVLAGLNSLTFEAVHPKLTASPTETATPVLDTEKDLPDWLKSLRTPMPVVETDSLAPLPEKPEKPVLDGPTAEGAAAELAVAAEAGPTTQAIGANGEGRILPAGESEEGGVEEKAKNRLADWLKAVDWKRVALEGTTIIPPMIFGGLLGYLDPETARNISLATGTAGIGLAFTSMAAVMAERILPVHTRAGLLGRALVAAKVVGLYGGNVLLSTAIGTHVGAGIREGIEVLHASQPAAGGGGEGFSNPHLGHRPVDASGNFGGVSPEDRGAGAIINPPAELPGQVGNLPGGGESGALPPGELGQPPQLPEIDVQKIVDSLPKHVGVAQLPENQQLGASHWRLAEAWSKPLANTFGLSDSARTFFTDAVKDLTQDQGNVRMDTIVNYDKRQIGDYLAEAVARLKETNPAGWQVKVPKDDLERLTKIAEFLKNSK